jgi:hypothetical protein
MPCRTELWTELCIAPIMAMDVASLQTRPNRRLEVIHMLKGVVPFWFMHYRCSALRVQQYSLCQNGLQAIVSPELGSDLTHYTRLPKNRLQQFAELSFIEEPS